jgi:hypothetical protein
MALNVSDGTPSGAFSSSATLVSSGSIFTAVAAVIGFLRVVLGAYP